MRPDISNTLKCCRGFKKDHSWKGCLVDASGIPRQILSYLARASTLSCSECRVLRTPICPIFCRISLCSLQQALQGAPPILQEATANNDWHGLQKCQPLVLSWEKSYGMILFQSPQGLGQGLNSLCDHFFAQSLPLSSSASSSLKDFLFKIKKHSSLYISHITKSRFMFYSLGIQLKRVPLDLGWMARIVSDSFYSQKLE